MSQASQSRRLWWKTCFLALVVVGLGRATEAQTFGGARPAGAASVATPPGGNSYIGPYANPYMMPGMNPYLYASAAGDPEFGMLTFLAMQRASGGIGSGRLSDGSAFRRRPSPAPAGARPAAFMPRSLARPTAGAERYFGRVPDRGGAAADYYHRASPRRYR